MDVARVEREAGIDQDPKWVDGPENQRVFGLLNKGAEFVELVEHPVVLALMEHLLDAAFLLSSITANVTGPGGYPMGLHYDQGYVPQPWPPVPLVANSIWMLDDFTEENGATRFVPGSHLEDHTEWTPEVVQLRASRRRSRSPDVPVRWCASTVGCCTKPGRTRQPTSGVTGSSRTTASPGSVSRRTRRCRSCPKCGRRSRRGCANSLGSESTRGSVASRARPSAASATSLSSRRTSGVSRGRRDN